MSNDEKFTPKGEEEMREEVIEKYNLTDEQSDLADSLTSDALESQEKLSKAIEQKIKHRDEAQRLANLDTPDINKPNKDGDQVNEVMTHEEIVMIAKGEEEEVDFLKLISKGSGISFKKAKETDSYKTFIRGRDVIKKEEASQLPASGKNSPTKPLSDDEHRDKFNKRVAELTR